MGAEYIIMDKANGVPLSSMLRTITAEKRFALTKEMSSLQMRWAKAPFQNHGSLYYSEEHDFAVAGGLHSDHIRPRNVSEFRVGPSTGRQWIDDGRDTIAFGRGPCEFKFEVHHCSPPLTGDRV